MGAQLDWIQQAARRQARLLALQESIEAALASDADYAGPCVRIGLQMIRRHHGQQAERETREKLGLTDHQRVA